MKLSVLHEKSMLWGRFIKLSILAIPMIWVTTLEFQTRKAPSFGKMMTGFLYRLLIFIRLFYRQFLNEDFLNSKCGAVEKVPALVRSPPLEGWQAKPDGVVVLCLH